MGESGGGFSGGSSGFAAGGAPERILLERVLIGRLERFGLLSPIVRLDPQYGEPHVVPRDPASFHSDLTSVPRLFTWLIPRTGAHLPAALLHDALVAIPLQASGPHVDRLEADRIFRDAMGELGTSLLRRWLMWTAVVIATVHRGATTRPWRYRLSLYCTVITIAGLGIIGTLHVLGIAGVPDAVNALGIVEVFSLRRDSVGLPPVLNESWIGRAVVATAAAVVIPLLLAPLWGSLWRAGLIAGWALAALLHVTALLLAFSLVFWLLERALELVVSSVDALRNRSRFSRRSEGAIRRPARRGGRFRWWPVRPRMGARIPRPN